MKLILSAISAASFVVLATPLISHAQDASCALSYDVYEYSVPHTDMETCPASIKGEGMFCRLSVMAEVATVFVFSEETSCLVSATAFEEDGFSITIN